MIGIITFHRAANYGTVLQTYALQKTLDKLNVENEVIDYRCKYIENIYNPFPTIGIKHTKTFILQVLRILPRLRVRIVFNKFLKEYVRMSTKIGRTKLKDISEKYDAIITGRCDNVNDYKNCVKMDWDETEEVLRNQAEISKRHLISMIRK